MRKCFPANVKTTITCEGMRLFPQFPVKDKNKFEHQDNLVYFTKCPDVNCKDTYVRETNQKITERITDQNR